MSKVAKVSRWSVRLLLLGAALALAAGGPVPRWLVRVFPSLSPLVAFSSSLAQRRWYLGLYWAAPAVAALLLAVWKGRLFCRWICPAGTLYSTASRLSFRKTFLKFPLNGWLFWALAGSAAVGVPLLAFLDPLSTFGRLTPLVSGTWTLLSLAAGVILPLALVLGAIQPMVWCGRICPLGYLFELVCSFRKKPVKTFSRVRRQILGGLLIGVPAGLLSRRFLFAKAKYKQAPILPPGADTPKAFAAACTRCYACVTACPSKIIRVQMDLDRAVGQFFQPELRYFDSQKLSGFGYCPEPCNKCSRVCPSGALTQLKYDRKWHRQIGLAVIIKKACLAWEDGQDCFVCQEGCPYQAIDMDRSPKGIARPVVDETVCRGCGACYSRCPAVRIGKAILMVGVDRQNEVDPDMPAPPPPPPV